MCQWIDCTANAQCPAGYICSGGYCQTSTPQCCDEIHIDQAGGRIKEGQTLQLTATCLNANGSLIANDEIIRWQSDNERAITVYDGLITGGNETGIATITVKQFGVAPSDSVVFRNYKAVEEGKTRVIAYDAETGKAISGANLAVKAHETKNLFETQTNEEGIAIAPFDCRSSCDVHLFPETHAYFSAFRLESNDILLPLSKHRNASVATGVKGYQDTSPIPDSVSGGMDVRIGFTGFSIPGLLIDFDFNRFLGEPLPTQVLDWEVLLPAGLELYLSGLNVREEGWTGYRAHGEAGRATLFGFGGYASLTEIIELVTGNMDEEQRIEDFTTILLAMLPLVESFYHGNLPGFDLESVAKVPDLGDLNGNGDEAESIPDYESWPVVGEEGLALKLTQWQSRMSSMRLGELPAMEREPNETGPACAQIVLTIVGARQSGVGFVPLGFHIGSDKRNDEDTPDCQVGDANDGKVDIVYAPQHDGVTGYDYQTISLAFSEKSFLSLFGLADNDAPIGISGELLSHSRIQAIRLEHTTDFHNLLSFNRRNLDRMGELIEAFSMQDIH